MCDAKVNGARQLAVTSIPSSSASSRISAASGVSPALTLPPGNSHNPAIDLPAGRSASSTRPSASTSATAATSTIGTSTAVAGIDVDVAVGQITSPYRRFAAADTDIDCDRDFVTLHVLGDRRLVIARNRAAIGKDREAADRDCQAVRIDLLTGSTHRHDDTAPIWVTGRKCRLDQWGIADRQADAARCAECCGPGHLDRHEFLGALAVACDLLGEIDGYRVECPAKTPEPLISGTRDCSVRGVLGGAE